VSGTEHQAAMRTALNSRMRGMQAYSDMTDTFSTG